MTKDQKIQNYRYMNPVFLAMSDLKNSVLFMQSQTGQDTQCNTKFIIVFVLSVLTVKSFLSG